MDMSKKAAFVRKMGKKRLSLSGRQYMGGGGIMGLIGAGGGMGGTGFEAPSGTNAAQIQNSYNQANRAIGEQQGITTTLSPGAVKGVNAQDVLSGQYANQAMGNGPNVAANMLNQATGANVANQAALMAGQRGTAANPALLARQAAMAGAGAQQQAAGQGATMQAQQQIAAQQAQAQLAANEIAQAQGAANAQVASSQGEQGILQGANTANNNIMGQLANTGLQGQQAVLGGAMKSLSGVAGGLFAEGGEVHESNPAHPAHGHKKLDFIHKMAKMGMENFDSGGIAVPQVTYNSQPLNLPAESSAQGGFTPGDNPGAKALSEGADALFSSMTKKKEPKDAPMGTTETSTDLNITGGNTPSQDVVGLNPVMAGEPMGLIPRVAGGGQIPHQDFQSAFSNYFMAGGGKVPAMVSPGEIYLPPDKVDAVVKQGADPLRVGERIPGKAKVKGDSYKNDTVPRDLDEGGVVVDRENAMDPKKASRFVQKAIAKKRMGRK